MLTDQRPIIQKSRKRRPRSLITGIVLTGDGFLEQDTHDTVGHCENFVDGSPGDRLSDNFVLEDQLLKLILFGPTRHLDKTTEPFIDKDRYIRLVRLQKLNAGFWPLLLLDTALATGQTPSSRLNSFNVKVRIRAARSRDFNVMAYNTGSFYQ